VREGLVRIHGVDACSGFSSRQEMHGYVDGLGGVIAGVCGVPRVNMETLWNALQIVIFGDATDFGPNLCCFTRFYCSCLTI